MPARISEALTCTSFLEFIQMPKLTTTRLAARNMSSAGERWAGRRRACFHRRRSPSSSAYRCCGAGSRPTSSRDDAVVRVFQCQCAPTTRRREPHHEKMKIEPDVRSAQTTAHLRLPVRGRHHGMVLTPFSCHCGVNGAEICQQTTSQRARTRFGWKGFLRGLNEAPNLFRGSTLAYFRRLNYDWIGRAAHERSLLRSYMRIAGRSSAEPRNR